MPQIPQGTLTRSEIITHALRRAGNTKLSLDAITWLDQILFDLYTQYSWPFLQTISAVTITDRTFTLPENFIRTFDDHAFKMVTINGQPTHGFILQVSQGELERRNSADTGVPQLWSAFHTNETGYVWPTPSGMTVVTQLLSYTYPDALVSDSSIPTFPWHFYLIQALYVVALEYEGDMRSVVETQRRDQMLDRIKRTVAPLRQQESTLPLDGQAFGPSFDGDYGATSWIR